MSPSRPLTAIHTLYVIRHSPDMRTIHLLRKYDPAQWGGTETAIQRLFGGLRRLDVESIVYCPNLGRKTGPDPLAIDGHRVKRFRAFLPVFGISSQRRRQIVSVGGNLMSLDLLPRLVREKDVSLVHTHALGRIGGIGRLAARWHNVPLAVTIHGGVLDLPPQMKKDFNTPIAGWEWGKIFGLILQSRRLLTDADAIITCNENEARLLREQYLDKRVVVQPHGVPLEIFQPDRREQALAAFPQIRGKQVLLSIGRIDPVKNQGWLVEQAPAIFQNHPHAILVLAGACTDEHYGEMIAQRIKSLGLEDRVLLTGGLPPNDPRLIGLMQEAEVLLLPSKSETFGLVILEAWATGTMVLSTRTSGACTLVRNGQNGWLFDLDRPETFHQPLSQALSKSDAVRGMLRRGGDEVHTQYNLSALALRMKKLYEELIEEKNAIRDPARRRHQCVDAR
ncbi:MAG TPA: glycosyltransferase [Verrucomicrobiae bacterium]|jgi:glycosyltransferase involved in cell wall biosynthesis|nr:glycosyltransferase [Verrucomicrobiae bacterium]